MEKAPGGTSVGVDDPYDHVTRCDFVTSEGKCRWAREHGRHDPEFANARSADDFRCPAAIAPDDADADTEPEWDWADCPHFRSRNHDRECVRCGLEERRMAHSDERPLLEEHHLSYRDGGDELSHEITVFLCRWCHAKIHQSWARLDDDVNPDPEAIAQREQRRSREESELGFESAADRYDDS
ncbi:hypothetical protein GOC83_06580 [Haloarcula rubripromontorii]|uniref:Uncharacterized protein n=1 Tax=Haloarcula rubripromontorii TaxID=1705562 RepID=A0A847TRQ3_9EURY|nr:hypothetical protein [Haloarcula rubripromontorii]NLV05803.1 hypothetical protein [Haloarcula rubripromontorii]